MKSTYLFAVVNKLLPYTSDDRPSIFIWIILLVAALAAIFLLVFLKKKSSSQVSEENKYIENGEQKQNE